MSSITRESRWIWGWGRPLGAITLLRPMIFKASPVRIFTLSGFQRPPLLKVVRLRSVSPGVWGGAGGWVGRGGGEGALYMVYPCRPKLCARIPAHVGHGALAFSPYNVCGPRKRSNGCQWRRRIQTAACRVVFYASGR